MKTNKIILPMVFASLSLAVLAWNAQMVTVLAEGEATDNTEINTASNDESYDFKATGLQRYSATGSTSSWSRAVSTMISLYVKNGTVPQITKYDGTYNGTAYHVLEADTSDGNTIIKLDYAGSTPQYLNNMYDKTLTANNEYYWAGAINAGFFSMANGYPTGAVRTNGNWQTYNGAGSNYETWDCTPAYGSGFTSVYFNQSGNDMKLLYNGWKNGVFYKYYTDPSPNTWDYSPVWDYTEGVSGAYTLMVDGNTGTHWGKGDYTNTDYWNYVGTAITLFGQKANGNYVLLTTSAGSLTADQAIDLMSKLGCTNAIRFDGGGSSQMAYDNGLYLKSIKASTSATVSSTDALGEIQVVATDGNGKTHTVPITAVSDEISTTSVDYDGNFTVTAKTVVGDITVNATVGGGTTPEVISSLELSFNKGYLTVGESTDDIKSDIEKAILTTNGVNTEVDVNAVEIAIEGNTSTEGSIKLTTTCNGATKEYTILVIDDTNAYKEGTAVGVPILKDNVITKDGTPTFTLEVDGETVETTNIILDGIDTLKAGLQQGTASYSYKSLSYADNGLLVSATPTVSKNNEVTIYVQGVEGIEINLEKSDYKAGDDLGNVTASFIQTNVDEEADTSEIVIDTSNVDMSKAGIYKITASYTPAKTITTEETKLSYSKTGSTALNYDWQLGINYDISATAKPSNISDATLAGLDEKLASGEYTFTKQGSTYFLVGGVDNSEYIRFSDDDTVAYVYKFEPYYWTNTQESGQTAVSTSTDKTWLSSEWMFGTTATAGYKYSGHKDESTKGTLVQNCWSVTRIAYDVTKTTEVTGEKTITALYGVTAERLVNVGTLASYTVKFYDFDGNLLDTETVDEGGTASTDAVPTKEGYKFTGWPTDINNITSDTDIYPTFSCSEGYDLADGVCTIHQETGGDTSGETDKDGENDKEDEALHVSFDWNYANSGNVWGLDGTELVLSENSFVKGGYTFTSWNTEMDGSGTAYYPGDKITKENITDGNILVLYAQWQKDTSAMKVSFDWNYANRGEMPTITVSGGETLPANEFERDGYTFTGWNTSINGDGTHYDDEATMPTLDSDTVLYAEWAKEEGYQIRFDWNYANSGSVDNIIYYASSENILPENSFIKDGYEFVGWNTSIDGNGTLYKAGDAITGITSDTTLYATWQKKPEAYVYTVTYDWNYANSGDMSADSGTNGEGYTAPKCNFKKDKKVFASWNTAINGTGRTVEAGETVNDIATNDGESIVLYAQWRNAGTTNIVYDWNYGNSGDMPVTVAYEGETVKLAKNTFKKNNATFIGWNTAMDGSGTSYKDEEIVDLFNENKDTIVLYAQWENTTNN